MAKKKILYLVAEDQYFCTHRLSLAKAAQNSGFDVVVATTVKNYGKTIKEAGIKLIPLKHFHRGSLNPFRDLLALIELYKIYSLEKPDLVHHVAMKPVLYGTLIGRLKNTPKIINALGGLGYIFSDQRVKANLLKTLVKFLLKACLNTKSQKLILQNPDDFNTLVTLNIVDPSSCVLIKGSGVDTKTYPLTPEKPIGGNGPHIVFAARMLWAKGIQELIDAAKLLKDKKLKFELHFYGEPDSKNPKAVPESNLRDWHDQTIIHWHGHVNSMIKVYQNCHIVALPSFYGEGIPRTLIEAASIGRPIVTTNTPGCREIVKDSINGFLVPIHDAQALAQCLETLIKDPKLRKKFGEAGHKMVEREFSEKIIFKKILELYTKK